MRETAKGFSLTVRKNEGCNLSLDSAILDFERSGLEGEASQYVGSS